MLLLDAALRISAATMLLLTALIAVRDARHLLQGKLAIALCISLAAMLINTIPEPMNLPRQIGEVAWALHIPNTVLVWLFGLSLFKDDFRMSKLHWGVLAIVWLILPAIRLSALQNWQDPLFIFMLINRFIAFSMLGHLIWTALEGRRDDLVASRRRTRLWFVLGVAITAVIVISGETAHFLYSGSGEDPDWLSTLRTAVLWPIIIFGAFWFLNIQPEHLLFESAAPNTVDKPEVNPKDAITLKRLTEAMETEQVFTEQGLTIGTLAEKISVPEHQLRSLINQGLGHRNFSAFLNSYRIAFAKKSLQDPEQARTPILTIAMDAGYNSLAPFNRAFKIAEGVTPTEFRRFALSNADQS